MAFQPFPWPLVTCCSEEKGWEAPFGDGARMETERRGGGGRAPMSVVYGALLAKVGEDGGVSYL